MRLPARLAAAGLALAAGAGWAVAGALPASAADDQVAVTATLDGRSVGDIDANSPLVLRPERELQVSIDVSNRGSAPVQVRAVRIDGRVLNMTFFNYTVRVDRTVDPGATESSTFSVDVSDLGDQAVGLIPGRLTLLDPEREEITGLRFPVDVKGPLTSAYGVFGLMVALVTAVLLASALIRLARRTLPANRWDRAVRFALPGIGLGLTFTFTLSALRALVPDADTWLTLVIVGGLLGLVIGFLTPGPAGDATTAGHDGGDAYGDGDTYDSGDTAYGDREIDLREQSRLQN